MCKGPELTPSTASKLLAPVLNAPKYSELEMHTLNSRCAIFGIV